MGNPGVCTKDKQETSVVDVGYGMDGAGAKYGFRGGKFIGAVLGPGGKISANLIVEQKRTDSGSCQRVKGQRIARIRGN